MERSDTGITFTGVEKKPKRIEVVQRKRTKSFYFLMEKQLFPTNVGSV